VSLQAVLATHLPALLLPFFFFTRISTTDKPQQSSHLSLGVSKETSAKHYFLFRLQERIRFDKPEASQCLLP